MSSRDAILARVRENTPPNLPLPEVPDFAADWPADWQLFTTRLTQMGGQVAAPTDDLGAWIRATWPDATVVVSATGEFAGTRPLDPAAPITDLHDVDIAVVRAPVGVAETGSVLLSHEDLDVEVLGFLAQHLVVLLDPADLVGNLHAVYRRPEFRTSRYTVLMTGPSATADIEGTLVHGAQGVRSLTLIPAPRPQ